MGIRDKNGGGAGGSTGDGAGSGGSNISGKTVSSGEDSLLREMGRPVASL